MAYNYTSPNWVNGGAPAINGANLNAISNLLAALGSSFDNGLNPAFLWGGNAVLGSGQADWLTRPTNGSIAITNNTPFQIPSDYCNLIIQGSSNAGAVILPPLAGSKRGGLITCVISMSSSNKLAISCNGSDSIGAIPGNTSFNLLYPGDYVVLMNAQYYWQVVSTNGPVIVSNQTDTWSTSGQYISTWTPTNQGTSFGLDLTLPGGLYDIELTCTAEAWNNSQLCLTIGTSSSTPLSAIISVYNPGPDSVTTVPVYLKCTVLLPNQYQIIEPLYKHLISASSLVDISYTPDVIVGRITARKIG